MYGIREIINAVPHRHPFLLIDRILDFEADRFVRALKNVTVNEACFRGHFPGRPVFPGALVIEAAAQAACFLLTKSRGIPEGGDLFALARVNRFSLTRPVVPGDVLVLEAEMVKRAEDGAIVAARAFVDGEGAAKGELLFGRLKGG